METFRQLMADVDAVAAQALAPTTRTQRAAAVRRYRGFAETHGMAPFPVSLPVALGWGASMRRRGCKPATFTRALSHLRSFTARHGLAWPSQRHDTTLRYFIRGWKALEQRPTRRPPPLTLHRLRRLLAVIDTSNPVDTQSWAQLSLSHALMLRTAEAVALRVQDILWEGGIDNRHGGVRVLLTKTKTTRLQADPTTLWLPPATVTSAWGPLFHPTAVLRAYMRSTCLAWARGSTPLFAKLGPSGFPTWPAKPQTYAAWRRRLASITAKAGMHGITPHASRAGGLTDAVMGGLPIQEALKIGRWSTNSASAKHYLRPGRAAARRAALAFNQAMLHAAAPLTPTAR